MKELKEIFEADMPGNVAEGETLQPGALPESGIKNDKVVKLMEREGA